jgi:hypothetical protein
MRPSFLRRTSLAAGLLAAALTAACTGGLDTSVDELFPPAVLLTPAVTTCPAAGTGSMLAISPDRTTITTGNPSFTPVNRIDVVGTVAGLGAGVGVLVGLVPEQENCPVARIVAATLDGAGGFTARLDIQEMTRFRVIALATAAPSGGVTCPADCVDTGGVAVSGISESLLVRLE